MGLSGHSGHLRGSVVPSFRLSVLNVTEATPEKRLGAAEFLGAVDSPVRQSLSARPSRRVRRRRAGFGVSPRSAVPRRRSHRAAVFVVVNVRAADADVFRPNEQLVRRGVRSCPFAMLEDAELGDVRPRARPCFDRERQNRPSVRRALRRRSAVARRSSPEMGVSGPTSASSTPTRRARRPSLVHRAPIE